MLNGRFKTTSFFAYYMNNFHITEVQMVILEMFPLPFFRNFAKETVCLMFFAFFCMFFIFVITFEPNKIQNRLAPQNDHMNLSFVKVIHVVGKKRSSLKTAI
jgi:hypothetical protein